MSFKNAIQQFTNDRFGNLRIIDRDGNPWFVGNDVARALGYTRPRDAIKDHCKGGVKMALPSGGGIQEMIIIPEADLFRLIMHSKLPEAEAFQDWVVEEVLPAIRNHGGYAPTRPKEIPVDANALIALVDRLKMAEDQMAICKPRLPYGTPSKINGFPRTSFVSAFFRSLKRRVNREIDELQRRLFDFQ